MNAKRYKVVIQTSKVEDDFTHHSSDRLHPVRFIRFDVFSFNEDDAISTAKEMCMDNSGHEFDEQLDMVEVEEVVDKEVEESHVFDSDYSQLS